MTSASSLLYTKEHMWVQKTADGNWLTGITDYAQDLLGDIVYLDPPVVATVIQLGQPCGLIESVKTSADLHAPMDGTITEINATLLESPEAINDAPYKAWIFKFTPTNADDTSHFLNAAAYAALIAES